MDRIYNKDIKKQRAKGKGSLVNRGGTYYGRWIIGGKVYTRTLKTSNKREAEERLTELLKPYVIRDEAASLANVAARLEGVNAEIKRLDDERPALTFRKAFAAFRSIAGRASAATLDMYESQFDRLCKWVGDREPNCKELRQFNSALARDFMAYIGQQFSANTFNKYLTLFRVVWHKLASEIRATQDPWEGIERKEQNGDSGRRALTVKELAAVCSSLKGEMRLLFALGIYTGLRLGDCALLKWESVDLARGLLHVLPHKTAKTRRVVTMSLHPSLAELLRNTPRDIGSPFVLPETAEIYAHDSAALVDRIQRTFIKAGIDTKVDVDGYSRKVAKVGFHSLRHTFVSLCGNGGIPLAYVQSIVGHSNPMMTSHYFHGDAEAHRLQLASALPDVINSEAFKTTNSRYKEVIRLIDKLTDKERNRLKQYLINL